MRPRRERQRYRSHPGQVLILYAVGFVMLLGFVALAIDVGHLLAQKRAVQNAADAAAMAAGRFLSQTGRPDIATNQAKTVALDYSEANGYKNQPGKTEIDVTPTASEVTVTVKHEVSKFFLGAVYPGPWRVTATATARLSADPGPYALIALGEAPQPGIVFGGLGGNQNGVTIKCDPPVAGCGSIGSNSDITLNGNVNGDIGGAVGAVGSVTGLPGTFKAGGGVFSGQGIIDDPLSPRDNPLPPPPCEELGPPADPIVDGKDVTLFPGHYTSAIQIPQEHNYTLKPGVYCFDGNFPPKKNAKSIDASAGVLLYFRNGSTFNADNAAIKLADARATNWKSWQDWPDGDGLVFDERLDKIAVWVDHTNASGACVNPGTPLVVMNGSGVLDVRGAVYAPCSSVEMGGNNTTVSLAGIVIGNDINIHGSVVFDMTTNSDYEAAPNEVLLVH